MMTNDKEKNRKLTFFKDNSSGVSQTQGNSTISACCPHTQKGAQYASKLDCSMPDMILTLNIFLYK